MLLFLMVENSRYRGPTTLPESHPMTDGGGHMLSTGKFQSGTTFRRENTRTPLSMRMVTGIMTLIYLQTRLISENVMGHV